jgi:hypothetical protein
LVDHSSCHEGYAPDALLVSKLNKGDGTKPGEVLLRMTLWPPPNDDGTNNAQSKPQSLMKKDGTNLGLLSIVTLRFGDSDASGRPYASYKVAELRELVSTCYDFATEKPQIFRVFDELGGARVVFLPLFHCDLAAVELLWAYLKRILNGELNGTASGLMEAVQRILGSTPLSTFGSFFRRPERFLRCYATGMDSIFANRAVALMTGRGGNGGAHISHARVTEDPPPKPHPLDNSDVVPDNGRRASKSKLAACFVCDTEVSPPAHCPICLRPCHTGCRTPHGGEAGGAGGSEAPAAVGSGAGAPGAAPRPCASCTAHGVRGSFTSNASPGSAGAGAGAGAGADANIVVTRLNEAEIGTAWSYLTAGVEDENGLQRLALVREEFAEFIFDAAVRMADAKYVGGPFNLLRTLLTQNPVPIFYSHTL